MAKSILKNFLPPTWDEFFLRKVYLISTKSKDPRTKYGSILVKNNHQIAEGYNGIPKGVYDFPDRLDKDNKENYIVHAEQNCCFMAARFGIATEGAILYCQGLPCVNCAKSLIQCGIKEVAYHKRWQSVVEKIDRPWVKLLDISRKMMLESGVSIRGIDIVLNVDGYLDGNKIRL
jgi:dCMP deaminase